MGYISGLFAVSEIVYRFSGSLRRFDFLRNRINRVYLSYVCPYRDTFGMLVRLYTFLSVQVFSPFQLRIFLSRLTSLPTLK